MIIFSKIIVSNDKTPETYEGLVAGKPKNYYDLSGWKQFEAYLEECPASKITVKVESFGYGEGEAFDAMATEVAYMKQRLDMRPDFLESRCSSVGNYKFTFDWDPNELFPM